MMRLQVLGDPDLMEQLRQVGDALIAPQRHSAELPHSGSQNLHKLLHQTLPDLLSCFVRHNHNTTSPRSLASKRSQPSTLTLLTSRLSVGSRNTFAKKLSWKTCVMPSNILQRASDASLCCSEFQRCRHFMLRRDKRCLASKWRSTAILSRHLLTAVLSKPLVRAAMCRNLFRLLICSAVSPDCAEQCGYVLLQSTGLIPSDLRPAPSASCG
jgi:hypothetical protein